MNYVVPREQEDMIAGYSELMKRLYSDRGYKPQSQIDELRSQIETQQKKYKRGVIKSSAALAVGLGGMAASYIHPELRAYVWALPEIVFLLSMTNAVRDVNLYVTAKEYGQEVDSAIKDFIRKPVRIK